MYRTCCIINYSSFLVLGGITLTLWKDTTIGLVIYITSLASRFSGIYAQRTKGKLFREIRRPIIPRV